MGLRRITASRLALAIALVVAAGAVGGLGSISRSSSRRAALIDSPAGVSPAASAGAPVTVGNAFVDKTPPPEDQGSPALDRRAYRYTTDQAIRLFQDRCERNPTDFVSLTILGEAQARKARECADPGVYERAEEALRKALVLLPGYARAQTALALVLCNRHKFAEGYELARQVYAGNPANLTALATIGDAELELGRYAEAEATFRRLLDRNTESSTLARMARLAELKGETEEALRLLRQAALAERSEDGAQGASWYEVRIGEISFDAGKLDDAEMAYRNVRKEQPEHRDAMAGLAQVCAARGRDDEAIALLTKAVASAAEPALLSDLGDLYLKGRQEARAERAFDRLEQTARRYPEHRRALSLFYSEHDRQLDRALELAEQELAVRRDIYGYDALAWALYKVGRPTEAAQAMAEALKLGTKDARLFYHAGMIDHRLGARASARTWLSRALALNPAFSLRDAEQARRALATLGGESDANPRSAPPP
jgi:tetratricopeptide (TPR) repeat protein